MTFSTATTVAAGTLAALLTILLLTLPYALAGLVLVAALTALSDIDFRTRLLPDALTLPLLVCGLVLSYLDFGPSLLSSVLGAAIGWLGLAALAAIYRSLRGFDGLGLGDAKLLGALGAWVGAPMLPFILLGAALAGLAFYLVFSLATRRFESRAELPFGPFLALAGWCVFIATRSGQSPFAGLSTVM